MKKYHSALLSLIAGIGFLSIWETRASIFAILLLIIAMASLSRFEHPRRSTFRVLLILSMIAAVLGMGRFVWQEALPGIAEARGRASGKKAVSLMREILFAQDALRRHGMIDPDSDGIGSAGRLGELSGSDPARGQELLEAPPLALRFSPRVATDAGPATEQDGHYIIICLPGTEQEWVTHPGAAVDEEKAERRWLAYAWPAQEGLAHTSAYFIDEHERILESDNRHAEGLRLVGASKAPDCNDALSSATSTHWKPWRGKEARKGLPGDK